MTGMEVPPSSALRIAKLGTSESRQRPAMANTGNPGRLHH
jgi:hypothetical protein